MLSSLRTRLRTSRVAVAAAGFVIMMISGAIWGSFTLFLVAIEADTGWSKTTIAIGFTIFTICGACTAPITGWLTDRHGARIVLASLSILFALGILLASLSTDPLIFYLTFGVLGGFGSQCCGTYTLFTVAGNWFKRPATAMAMMDSGAGIGTVLALPLLRWIMETHSWRAAYVALAIAAVVVVLPLAGLFMRLYPPDVAAPAPLDGVSARRSPLAAVQAIIATPVLRWLAIVHLLAPLTFHAYSSHQIAFMQDAGFTTEFAVLLVSATGFTFFVSRLSLGALIDWKGIAATGAFMAATALISLGVMFAILLMGSDLAGYAHPILFAAGFSATGILFTNAARQLIEPASFNAVFGALRLLYGLGVALGPPVMAAMVDTTHRFDLPFALVGIVLVFHHAAFIALALRYRRR